MRTMKSGRFCAKGKLTSEGGLREWSHGTLQALIEPTRTGYRLRLADSNSALGGVAFGGFIVAFALLILMAVLSTNDPGFRLAVPAFFFLLGGSLAAGSACAHRSARQR